MQEQTACKNIGFAFLKDWVNNTVQFLTCHNTAETITRTSSVNQKIIILSKFVHMVA